MKFITESELRSRYQKEPFSEYPYQENSRLTPGGRQFLLDRGIKIMDRETKAEAAKNCSISEANPLLKPALQTVRASFLKAGAELAETDILVARELFNMEQYLGRITRGEEQTEKLDNQPCTGLHCENFNQNMGICFEIDGFHAQTEHGRQIVTLHYLRSLLMEKVPDFTDHDQNSIYCIVNRLSQMICRALGGTTCQRKL